MSARFRESAPYAAFLETISIEASADTDRMMLACVECGEDLCFVEEHDSLGVLVRTALAHDDECARPSDAD